MLHYRKRQLAAALSERSPSDSLALDQVLMANYTLLNDNRSTMSRNAPHRSRPTFHARTQPFTSAIEAGTPSARRVMLQYRKRQLAAALSGRSPSDSRALDRWLTIHF